MKEQVIKEVYERVATIFDNVAKTRREFYKYDGCYYSAYSEWFDCVGWQSYEAPEAIDKSVINFEIDAVMNNNRFSIILFN